jgi:pteridine reductase
VVELKNKAVLITGGAVRLGRSISLELAAAGAVVFCHYHRSEEAAKKLKAEIEKAGGQIYLLQSDLSHIPNTESLLNNVMAKSGRVDILINNAALFYQTPLGTVTEEQWDRLFDLNLKAAFFCARYAGRYMVQQGHGKIINLGDTCAENPWPSSIPYALTKAGIIAMTRGLAKELAPQVQVNCVNPGPVLLPEAYDRAERNRSIERTLLKREGSPEDVVRTVRFLIEGSDYITGTVITVDGGRSIG